MCGARLARTALSLDLPVTPALAWLGAMRIALSRRVCCVQTDSTSTGICNRFQTSTPVEEAVILQVWGFSPAFLSIPHNFCVRTSCRTRILRLTHPGTFIPHVGLPLLPLDCVSTHAALVINAYPRIPSPGEVQGFRLAPCKPSRAKVLRAGLAVIARRAYELIGHLLMLGRRGRGNG